GMVKATLVERMCGCCIDIEYEWSGPVLPPCAGFCAAVLTGFFDFVEEPRRALSCQRAHHMSFALLDREIHGITLAAEQRSLLLHLIEPTGIELAHMHVNAEIRKCRYAFRRRIRKEARQSGDGSEILRVHGRNVKGASAAIRHTGNMEFVVSDFVFPE